MPILWNKNKRPKAPAQVISRNARLLPGATQGNINDHQHENQ
jgi:hypothetical protein